MTPDMLKELFKLAIDVVLETHNKTLIRLAELEAKIDALTPAPEKIKVRLSKIERAAEKVAKELDAVDK